MIKAPYSNLCSQTTSSHRQNTATPAIQADEFPEAVSGSSVRAIADSVSAFGVRINKLEVRA
jgi:hypothetical protein